MSYSLRFGRAGHVLTLATLTLLASACGAGGDEDEGSPEREDIGAEPVTEDAASFAARFAVVSGIVGEDAARRVMSRRAREATPLYKQELAGGERVDWYEPFEGFAVVAVRGTVGKDFDAEPFKRSASASELFRALEPNQALPAQLRELDQRRTEMLPAYQALSAAKDSFREFHVPGFSDTSRETDSAIDTSRRLGDDVAQQRFAITADECVAKAGLCIPGTSYYDWREPQKNRTETSRILTYDTYFVSGTACAQTGVVTHRVRYQPWWDWNTYFGFDLEAGEWVGHWTLTYGTFLDFDFDSMLFNFESGDKGSQVACGLSY